MNRVFTGIIDLRYTPPTYDVVVNLIELDRLRREADCEFMRVVLLPGPDRGFRKDGLWPSEWTERVKMRDNVAAPMALLLPACREVIISDSREIKFSDGPEFGRGLPFHGCNAMVSLFKRGLKPLRAPSPVKARRDYVTITLREAEHWPMRNSDLEAWTRAAVAIECMGWAVVFIRDTARAGEDVATFATNHVAARDVIARANLYAGAALNLGTNNGPMWMAAAMDAPLLLMTFARDGAPGAGFKHARQYGFAVDPEATLAPFPGPGRHQAMCWKPSTPANIVDAFAAQMDVLNKVEGVA